MWTRVSETVIGREHPAGVLRAEIDRVAESHGGLVLVTGEPGIGKTTLVTGAAEAARDRGVTVVGGRCWDSESAPGYWPWVQVLRGLHRQAAADEWAAIEEAGGGSVAALLGRATRPEEQADTFSLYDDVTAALVAASQHRPVMVVLDDLHWADPASLRLLEFAVQHTWFERLLLVGTYRDVEVESVTHPLRALMLPLVAKATTVTLTGLEPAEVAALITRAAGREPSAAVVAEVHRRTGGNPFFVEQTARLWRAGGSVSAIAPGVRDAVRRRLDLLPDPLVELLTTASVLGHEFHRQLLAASVAAPVPEVDRLLDGAMAARLVVGRGGGRFAFGHDLVRETLYDALPDQERHDRHAAVVRAVGRTPTLRDRLFPSDLARHAYAAGALVEPAVVVEHLLAAAREASGRLAPEEAMGHLRRALERAEDPARRVLIHLDLAQELLHGGGRRESWDHIEAAASLARDVDDPAVLARVALVADRHRGPRSREAPLIEPLLREAHARLVGADDGDLPRDRLVGELIRHAEMLARESRNDEALAFSLWSRHDSIWRLGSAREREALLSEMETVARRSGDSHTATFAASLRWVALLELGDPRYYAQLQTMQALAEQVDVAQVRLALAIDSAIIATLRGEFTAAETLLHEIRLHFDSAHDDYAYMGHHVHWALHMQRGRFAEAGRVLGDISEARGPYLALAAALTAAAQGDPGPGTQHIADNAGRPCPPSMEPLFLRLLAEVAVLTGDPAACAQARAAFAPHRGRWLVSVYGCDVSGPVDLWVAMIDAAEGRWHDALSGFASARAAADLLGARPWSLTARLGLATALLDSGASAVTLLAEVEREAAEIGMPHLAAKAAALAGGSGLPPPAATADGAGPPSQADARVGGPGLSGAAGGTGLPGPALADPAVDAGRVAGVSTSAGGRIGSADPAAEFRREGDVWRLAFAGRVVHLPDAKGLRNLHVLLSRPGDDIAAVELLDPAAGPELVAARRMGGDPIIDDEAKARYRRRLGELDEAIDTASLRGDTAKVDALDEERRALIGELRVAAGLAGRTRRLGDEAERVRKTVTARIRDALRKIDERHPDLGAHLRDAVSTGTTCRYAPPAEVRWRL
ncbi:AAA family ATPase [Dactylosporangium roseum]|uniref:AAA family ATPase n=1 Tax=Dactylosporangium roseum TaxID=47989 RepID=A0ABY5Z3F2_9ACTN|nr:AAA family ATPase [Dactylosporangium roseum]UWZ35397.1 AAA family ATPase [Dactylosporangium roseum]